MGFQQHPKPDSLGKVLRSKDVVIWIITGLKDFDDVDGHLTPFPCEDEDDTVWLEIPRPLWAKGPYPKHYDEKQGGDILIKVPLEDVDQRASEVRGIYRTKAAETFHDAELEALRPKELNEGKTFLHAFNGEAMHPYTFRQDFAQRVNWRSAPRPSDQDSLGAVTHIIMAFTTHRNYEDKVTQMLLCNGYCDKGRYKIRLP